MTVKDVTERAATAVSDDLVADALEGGVELLGPDGVLAELTKLSLTDRCRTQRGSSEISGELGIHRL
ncbi:MAG: hypothetical protein OXC98_04330 [bacterium]|nr:hypothetical protein [bacterium]